MYTTIQKLGVGKMSLLLNKSLTNAAFIWS